MPITDGGNMVGFKIPEAYKLPMYYKNKTMQVYHQHQRISAINIAPTGLCTNANDN
jgi:hypothetical protein